MRINITKEQGLFTVKDVLVDRQEQEISISIGDLFEEMTIDTDENEDPGVFIPAAYLPESTDMSIPTWSMVDPAEFGAKPEAEARTEAEIKEKQERIDWLATALTRREDVCKRQEKELEVLQARLAATYRMPQGLIHQVKGDDSEFLYRRNGNNYYVFCPSRLMWIHSCNSTGWFEVNWNEGNFELYIGLVPPLNYGKSPF